MTLRFRLTGQPGNLSDIMAELRKCPRGWIVEAKPPTRSLEQSSRMWAMLDEISAHVMWDGERLTSEEWKWIFTAALKRQKIVRGIDGGLVAIGAHTSTMSIQDMGDLMELMTEFGVTRGVTFKFPEDQHTNNLPGAQKALGGEAGARMGVSQAERAPAHNERTGG